MLISTIDIYRKASNILKTKVLKKVVQLLEFFMMGAMAFKGHLHYKTIFSQSILYEAQVKNVFIA